MIHLVDANAYPVIQGNQTVKNKEPPVKEGEEEEETKFQAFTGKKYSLKN